MEPTPGIRPTQLAERTNRKIVAKNQNVRSVRCGPIIPEIKLYKLSISHSKKFWAPAGTGIILFVANCAKTINPSATTQPTTIELVIGKPSGRAISTALGERPCYAGSGSLSG